MYLFNLIYKVKTLFSYFYSHTYYYLSLHIVTQFQAFSFQKSIDLYILYIQHVIDSEMVTQTGKNQSTHIGHIRYLI